MNRLRLATPNDILLLAAALLPRMMALGRYVTPDELFWVERSLGLRRALLDGDWAATIQSGHPGVTTSWLGALGAQLQLWLMPGQRAILDWLETLYWLSPDNFVAFKRLSLFLSSGRLLVILVTSLGILLIYHLAQPLLGDHVALIGALLLALDPFTAGLSGLLHLDALLATFCLLAILFILPGRSWRPALPLWAGVCSGLALLTKTPGAIMLLFVPAVLLWRTVVMRHTNPAAALSPRQCGQGLLLWGMGLLGIALLLLPALWADPGGVYTVVAGLSGRLLNDAVRPIFYLGDFTNSPGPGFYPLVVFLRLSPVVTIGLLGLAVAALSGLTRGKRTLTVQGHNLLLLVGFSVAFLLMLTLAAKKFDRYALPAIMPLLLSAGYGFDQLRRRTRLGADAYTALVGAAQLIFLAAVLPFPLAAYNWLGGGSWVAEKVMTIGWGEATSVAAADLGGGVPAGAALPTLYTDNVAAAAPFYPGPVELLTANNLLFAQNGDSLLAEAASWQGGEPDLLAGREASQFWRLRGLEARRYQVTDVVPLPRQRIGWRFGEAATVTQATLTGAAPPARLPIALTVSLRQPAPYQIILELRDPNGYSWVSLEQPLLNAADQPGNIWVADVPYQLRYDLALPADLPPGQYEVSATFFADGARLGVFDGGSGFAGVAMPLGAVPISAPAEPIFQPLPNAATAGDQTALAGYLLPDIIDNGSELALDIWWRAGTGGGQLALGVGEAIVTTPMQPPTTPAGHPYHLRPSWTLPLELAGGAQRLTLQLLDDEGQPLWPQPFQLGEVEVRRRERSFTLPNGLQPMALQLADLAYLQGAEARLEGDHLLVELVWQARGPLDRGYFHFVHLRDSAGAIRQQSDRPPTEPTTFWVAGQVIMDTILFDRPEPGQYTVAIGLYDPETGVRPRLFDSLGAPLPGDQYDQFLLTVTVP